MTGELVKQILSSSVVAATIVAIFGGAWKIIQDRRSNRHVDDRDATDRLSDFQAAAEDHILNYDVPMRECSVQLRDRSMQHEALINQLRMEAGHDPIAFPPLPGLPDPVPLYTRRKKG